MLFVVAAVACDARPPPYPRRVPTIDGSWLTLVRSPDLGPLNGPEQQPVDFALWRARDGSYQLWSCIRGTAVGGQTRLFYRWEGTSLDAPDFRPMGVAMTADASLAETPGGLQAPYVVRVGDAYWMLYGDWQHIDAQTSSDGKTFTRELQADGTPALFSEGPGANTRDPMVLALEDGFVVYDAANPAGVGAVYARTSRDLERFDPPRIVARGGSAGSAWNSAECPHVIYEPESGDYFLFRTQAYAPHPTTRVYRSKDPLDFGIDDDRYLIAVLPVAAPEIIHEDESWYIAALLPDLSGIRVARLRWTWE